VGHNRVLGPDPAFFLIADTDLGLCCEFNSKFKELFKVFFSLPLIRVILRTLFLGLTFSKASSTKLKVSFKFQKRAFLQIYKKPSKFKCNFYTWIRIQKLKLMQVHADPDRKPWAQQVSGKIRNVLEVRLAVLVSRRRWRRDPPAAPGPPSGTLGATK
jgi:hypothetical protein